MELLPEYHSHTKLSQQLQFLIELDKIKNIVRKTKLFDGSRFENDAEHSWTACVMAVLLREHSNVPVDLEKVLTMLLLHDVVEIDAGDTFLYAPERKDAYAKEQRAAERIFGLLDPDQKAGFIALWEEFEQRTTNEARFAAVFDRLEPILQNYVNEGLTWKKNRVTYEMVLAKNSHLQEGSRTIWDFVKWLLDDAATRGYLEKEER